MPVDRPSGSASVSPCPTLFDRPEGLWNSSAVWSRGQRVRGPTEPQARGASAYLALRTQRPTGPRGRVPRRSEIRLWRTFRLASRRGEPRRRPSDLRRPRRTIQRPVPISWRRYQSQTVCERRRSANGGVLVGACPLTRPPTLPINHEQNRRADQGFRPYKDRRSSPDQSQTVCDRRRSRRGRVP